jgi:hypothetical protein
VPLGLACVWITRRHVVESRDPRARRIDWPGQAVLTAGLFLLVLALLRGNDQGWTSGAIVAELAGALALLAAFVAIERRTAEPMFPLVLFGDRPVAVHRHPAHGIGGAAAGGQPEQGGEDATPSMLRPSL